MQEMINIRNEEKADYAIVEQITREAFLQYVCSRMRRALSGAYYAGT